MRNLSLGEKYILFSELTRLEKSGIPRLQALSILGENSLELSKRAKKTRQRCNQNVAFPLAAQQTGLFNDEETSLIKLAEQTSQYEAVYAFFEARYHRRLIQQKKFKSAMILPLAILILGLFILPLPALITNTITVIDYTAGIFLTLFKLSFIIFLGIKLPGWIKTNRLGHSIKSLYFKGLITLPLFSNYYIQAILLDYFRLLSLSLAAGLPVIQSLKLCQNTIENVHVRIQLDSIVQNIEGGETLTQAIMHTMGKNQWLDAALQQALLTGEYSGSLDQSIQQMVSFLDIFLQQSLETFYQWLPKIFYVLILTGLGYNLIN